MKRFETGEELAKEMGLPASKLEQVFADYTKVVKDPKTDPFGKKLSVFASCLRTGFSAHPLPLSSFSNTDWSLKSGPFNVALMTPVLHCELVT